MAKPLDESEFEFQSRYNVHFRTNTLGKLINSLIPPDMDKIVPLLFFYKDGFGIRYPTNVDMPLNEMDTATRVQILDETDCISHRTNTVGKGMNPIILPPAMGK